MDLEQEASRLAGDARLAQELYAALCNNQWRFRETGELWSCSWRSSGGIVARLRERAGGSSVAPGDCQGCGLSESEHISVEEEWRPPLSLADDEPEMIERLWCPDQSGWMMIKAHAGSESYLDYYCSGMTGDESAREGEIRERVREMLSELGWEPV